jgi:hypothetical protein
MEDNNLEWSNHYEEIFIDWCDKAMCYRYLHSNCNRYYNYLQNLFTIPVIFISTITGVANFAQDRIPVEYQVIFTMGVGSFNILAGFITTVSQFLKISEMNEGHRVSCISWGKFCRNIKVELAKHPKEREPLNNYLKTTKEQYDLLLETSPIIRYKEIVKFNKTFKSTDFFKPEICDSLVSVKNTVFKSEIPEPNELDTVIHNIANTKNNTIKDLKIEEFVTSFTKQNSRGPTIEEIYENLEDNVNKAHIDKFMQKIKPKINNGVELDNINIKIDKK